MSVLEQIKDLVVEFYDCDADTEKARLLRNSRIDEICECTNTAEAIEKARVVVLSLPTITKTTYTHKKVRELSQAEFTSVMGWKHEAAATDDPAIKQRCAAEIEEIMVKSKKVISVVDDRYSLYVNALDGLIAGYFVGRRGLDSVTSQAQLRSPSLQVVASEEGRRN